jgi:hypothetical protein
MTRSAPLLPTFPNTAPTATARITPVPSSALSPSSEPRANRIRSRERSGARAPRERAVPPCLQTREQIGFGAASEAARQRRGSERSQIPLPPRACAPRPGTDTSVPLHSPSNPSTDRSRGRRCLSPAPEATARAARPEPSPATRTSPTPTPSPTHTTSATPPKLPLPPRACAPRPATRSSATLTASPEPAFSRARPGTRFSSAATAAAARAVSAFPDPEKNRR